MIYEDWLDVLSFVAVVTTIGQFLTGILVCQNFVKNQTVGDASFFPFLCGFFSSMLWLRYGFFKSDSSFVFVNAIGSVLQAVYCLIYYIYSIKKSTVLRQFIIVKLFLILSFIYTDLSTNPADEVEQRFGLLCCVVTIMFFASPLTSLHHVMSVKTTESLPFPIISSTFVVSLEWSLYGYMMDDWFIELPNLIGVVLSTIQLSLYLIYPAKGYSLVVHPL